MTLTFGLVLMNDFPPGTHVRGRVESLREQAVVAGENGMRSLWVLQHYLGSMPTLQPLQVLASVAEHAGDMALGTNMFILPLRHPVEVAEEFATLDNLAAGGAVAGFGLGYRENEFASFGVAMDERVERFEESIAIIRSLWSGEPTTYVGRHFAIDDQTISMRPATPGGPPIWVGAGPHRTGAQRAARLGDAWLIPPHVPPAKLATLLGHYTDERRRLGLGESELVVRRELLLDSDASRARETGLAARGAVTRQYARYNAPQQGDAYRHLQDEKTAEEVADTSYVFTDPTGAVARFKELESLGITHVVLRAQWYDLPQERVLRTLELFGRDVLPAFT